MKQQEVFKKIGGIIKELSEQYEYLKTAEEPLNELELELFLANSNFLTDHMVILSKLNAQAAGARKEKEPELVQPKRSTAPEPPKNIEEPRYFEPLVQSVLTPKSGVASIEIRAEDEQDKPENVIVNSFNPVNHVEPEPETIRHELIIDEADLDDEEELVDEPIEERIAPVKAEPVVEPSAIATEEKQPLKETPEHNGIKEHTKQDVPTINERMSAQLGERNGISDNINLQPISDLKAGINMNDKLLYVKELFNGYNLAYSEAIEILNRFSSFEEADTFLKKNYVTKNSWDSKPETTDKFYTILRRRYA